MPEHPPTTPDMSALADSVRCRRCEYVITPIDLDRNCSECGAPVRLSVLPLYDPWARVARRNGRRVVRRIALLLFAIIATQSILGFISSLHFSLHIAAHHDAFLPRWLLHAIGRANDVFRPLQQIALVLLPIVMLRAIQRTGTSAA